MRCLNIKKGIDQFSDWRLEVEEESMSVEEQIIKDHDLALYMNDLHDKQMMSEI